MLKLDDPQSPSSIPTWPDYDRDTELPEAGVIHDAQARQRRHRRMAANLGIAGGGIAVVVALLIIFAGGSANGQSTTSAAANARCRTGQLSLRLGPFAGNIAPSTMGAGAADGASATFVNVSSSGCTLEGYPTIQMLQRNGAPMPTEITRNGAPSVPSYPVKRVVLAPHGRALFYFGYEAASGYGNDYCPTSAAVRITPPGDPSSLTEAWHLQPYGGLTQQPRCGLITVSAVVR